VGGVNGALPAAEECASQLASLTGGEVRVQLHTRLHQLDRVVPPAPTRGSLRAATVGDVDLVVAWFDAFSAAADEQAGRPPGSMHRVTTTPEAMLRRLEREEVWLWVEEDGTPVHLTAQHPPSFGVARVAPVFTPREHRGRGYAANTVATVSQRILDDGDVPCLYTDQANPTSSSLYAALGYRPVVDMVDLLVD
jgi:predicted GNAT family acetyltransferase